MGTFLVIAARAAPSALDVSPWTTSRSGLRARRDSNASVTAPACRCGSSSPGHERRSVRKPPSPNSARSSRGCWPVRINEGVDPRSASAWATVASLMASGLVPITSRTSAKRKLPPSSAAPLCRCYGRSSTEIVGVSLDFEPNRRRRHEMIVEPSAFAVGDRSLFRGENHPHLRVGVAGAVPAGQRIRPKRLLPLELEDPLAGIGLARLGRLAFVLEDARDGHAPQVAKRGLRIKTRASI